ncbi:MAG TPA: HD domain-containing phosphohydrolase [Bacillota bacterium]|nr:HD domain-containing phosphohydrolase [Bacillota bacterium]
MKPTVIIVDDESMITTTLSTLIKMVLKINVKAFNDPVEALSSDDVISKKADLIISDFMMPGMNGLEFFKSVKEKNPDAVRILLTGYADKENAIRSINEIGLYYYMEKPWDNEALIKIIQNGLEKKELSDSLKEKYEELEESNQEINRLYKLLKLDYQQEVDSVKNLIISLANVIEAKDKYTEGHTRRVAAISRLIGEKLGLDSASLKNLEISGIIHDIGKVGVPESILNKPGKLTDEEFEVMKQHSVIGETICRPLNCLENCLDPIRHHHEKLDGSGYPDGLSAEALSLEARILTVADIFDALQSKRPYRDSMPMEKVKSIISEDVAHGQLDARVVRVLFELIDSPLLEEILHENGSGEAVAS